MGVWWGTWGLEDPLQSLSGLLEQATGSQVGGGFQSLGTCFLLPSSSSSFTPLLLPLCLPTCPAIPSQPLPPTAHCVRSLFPGRSALVLCATLSMNTCVCVCGVRGQGALAQMCLDWVEPSRMAKDLGRVSIKNPVSSPRPGS